MSNSPLVKYFRNTFEKILGRFFLKNTEARIQILKYLQKRTGSDPISLRRHSWIWTAQVINNCRTESNFSVKSIGTSQRNGTQFEVGTGDHESPSGSPQQYHPLSTMNEVRRSRIKNVPTRYTRSTPSFWPYKTNKPSGTSSANAFKVFIELCTNTVCVLPPDNETLWDETSVAASIIKFVIQDFGRGNRLCTATHLM